MVVEAVVVVFFGGLGTCDKRAAHRVHCDGNKHVLQENSMPLLLR